MYTEHKKYDVFKKTGTHGITSVVDDFTCQSQYEQTWFSSSSTTDHKFILMSGTNSRDDYDIKDKNLQVEQGGSRQVVGAHI